MTTQKEKPSPDEEKKGPEKEEEEEEEYRRPVASKGVLDMVAAVLRTIIDHGYEVDERFSQPARGEFNFVDRKKRFSLRLKFEVHSPKNFRLLYGDFDEEET